MSMQKIVYLLTFCLVTYPSYGMDQTHALETPRLILREFNQDDLAVLIVLRSDASFMSFSHQSTPEQTQEFLEKNLTSYRADGSGKRAVIDKVTGKIIGYCGPCRVKIDGEPKIEVGYRLAQETWGKGFGTEAAAAARDYAFDCLGAKEVISCVDPENKPSIRVAEKLGMLPWKDTLFMGSLCRVYRMEKP